MNDGQAFLLTGAGFTYNFGGPLAAEMWAMILNDPGVGADETLRLRLLEDKDLDFEGVYHEVLNSGVVTRDQKDLLTAAILRAYRQLDLRVREWPGESRRDGQAAYRVKSFIRAFGMRRDQLGLVFTLNQDLLLERKYWNSGNDPRVEILDVRGKDPWFQQAFCQEFNRGPIPEVVELARTKEVELQLGRIHYVKLHGSCNWIDAGGAGVMVLGRGKHDSIKREPLLQRYFDLFRSTLTSQKGAKLLVTGYGFQDPHVNAVLAEAIESHGLKLYLLDPTSPTSIRKRLECDSSTEAGRTIWKGVFGYYQATLDQLAPEYDSSPLWVDLHTSLFGRGPLPFTAPF